MSQPGHEKESYEEYLLKFIPKKTKDDTYTPEPVYNALRDHVVDYYGLDGRQIVRPFWPNADFTKAEYPEGCVVIDNPPFSIQAKIIKWFTKNHIDYYLFANHTTILNNWKKGTNVVITAAPLKFENGAIISISFLTSMGDAPILIDGVLYYKLMEANKTPPKTKAKIDWPEGVMSGAMLQKYVKYGKEVAVDGKFITHYKSRHIFGGGIELTPESVDNLKRLEQGEPVIPFTRSETKRITLDSEEL